MKITTFFNEFHYKSSYTFKEKLLFVILYGFSQIYKLITEIRLILYRLNILKTFNAKATVISVGNLTTGGTGKSPLTIEIAKYLSNVKEKKVGILSRGYGKEHSKQKYQIVRTRNKIIAQNASSCGDEAYMMAQQLENTVIITGSNRSNSARLAIEKYDCNTLLLDDGYQHIKLNRDFNILVIDSLKLFGNGYLIPAGPLRESLNQIKRADAIIIVNKGSSYNHSKIQTILEPYKKSIYFADYVFDSFINLKDQSYSQKVSEDIIMVFCGIAQPDSFFNQIKLMNKTIVTSIVYPDHHNYKATDLEIIQEEALKSNCNAIFTTDKDSVKIISKLDKIQLPIYSIRMKMNLDLDKLLENI